MKRDPKWRKALPVPKPGKGNLRIYAKQDVGNDVVVEHVLDFELPSSAVTKIIDLARELAPRVHIIRGGKAFCGMPGVPRDWPEGHFWVDSPERGATCDRCVEVYGKVLAAIARGDLIQPPFSENSD